MSDIPNATNRLKVKITKGPEPVPKKRESKLPPRDEDDDSGGDGDGSDDDWDEASIIDGHAWWESDSEDEVRLALEAFFLSETQLPRKRLAYTSYCHALKHILYHTPFSGVKAPTVSRNPSTLLSLQLDMHTTSRLLVVARLHELLCCIEHVST